MTDRYGEPQLSKPISSILHKTFEFLPLSKHNYEPTSTAVVLLSAPVTDSQGKTLCCFS